MAPHALDAERNPAIAEYAGTSFRSRMKAGWAAYFAQPISEDPGLPGNIKALACNPLYGSRDLI